MSEPSQSLQLSNAWDRVRAPGVWMVVVSVLGFSLWAQLFLVPLMTEVNLAAHRPLATLAYLAPIALLATGLSTRKPVLLLGAFPMSLLPGLAMMPEQEVLLFYTPWVMLRVGLTMALFVALASAGAERAREVSDLQPTTYQDEHPDLELQLRYVRSRLVILLAMLIVPAQALFADARIDEMLLTSYGEDQIEVMRSFLGLFHFFVWCVASYMMVLVPAINMEYDQRRLSRRIDEMGAKLKPSRIGLRIAAYLVMVALLVGLSLAMG